MGFFVLNLSLVFLVLGTRGALFDFKSTQVLSSLLYPCGEFHHSNSEYVIMTNLTFGVSLLSLEEAQKITVLDSIEHLNQNWSCASFNPLNSS